MDLTCKRAQRVSSNIKARTNILELMALKLCVPLTINTRFHTRPMIIFGLENLLEQENDLGQDTLAELLGHLSQSVHRHQLLLLARLATARGVCGSSGREAHSHGRADCCLLALQRSNSAHDRTEPQDSPLFFSKCFGPSAARATTTILFFFAFSAELLRVSDPASEKDLQ